MPEAEPDNDTGRKSVDNGTGTGPGAYSKSKSKSSENLIKLPKKSKSSHDKLCLEKTGSITGSGGCACPSPMWRKLQEKVKKSKKDSG